MGTLDGKQWFLELIPFSSIRVKLELLSPAKNLEYGREAINHGADAVYIGAPAFGARAAATNSLNDIEALVNYAHLFGSKVFATVNTLLFDDELEPAVQMIHKLYDMGVDALIIQDMGLLQCDLPPIELHASTQCHNASVERIKFLEQAGFKRVILARETSLQQMQEIRRSTAVDLEAFIHGALCVSYSGQCYMSQYLNQRSGNRGCCSQPCRSSYDLLGRDNRLILRDRHLLSLKDFNASEHLQEMIDAGITSFKIEGRLKDLSYVKNITAYYRQLLDSIMSGHERASSGHTIFHFNPDPKKTFNRGYTDYFLVSRQPMANFATQKSLGAPVGKVIKIDHNTLVISGDTEFTAGDGLCFFDPSNRLQGFLVNRVEGRTIVPNNMPDIAVSTPVWRNHDHAFERMLSGDSATRKIDIDLEFNMKDDGFILKAVDADGVAAETSMHLLMDPSGNPEAISAMITKQLSKMGGSPFMAKEIKDMTHGKYFLPVSAVNKMRRDVVETLIAHRIKKFHPKSVSRLDQQAEEAGGNMDYRANVLNRCAEEFYNNHGINIVEYGLEKTESYDNKALMTTKYCLRYELGCCLRGKNQGRPQADITPDEELLLRNNDRLFRLQFDCKNCQMLIFKR